MNSVSDFSVACMFALFLSLVALGFTQDTYHKDEAHRFCKKQGGTVFTFGLYTSPPPYGLLINEHMEVCSIPRTDNGSPFLVPLETLTNPLPSLAVLAFNAKIPRMFVISSSYCEAKAFDPNGDIASPAGVYCAELGGSTAGHLIAYGGVDWYCENLICLTN